MIGYVRFVYCNCLVIEYYQTIYLMRIYEICIQQQNLYLICGKECVRMNKLYFITGSQNLYGEETLKQAASDSKEMSAFLNDKLGDLAEVCLEPVATTAAEAENVCVKASADKDCIGVIMWMHTFSPAKMWIRALKAHAPSPHAVQRKAAL